MSPSDPKIHRCPQCGTAIANRGTSFPFCSERCQMLDLGAWAAEKYRIAAVENEDQDENSEEPEH